MLSACVGVGPDSPPGPRGQYSGHMGHAAYQAAHLCCRRGCTGTEEHRPAYKLVYELGQGSWGPATVSAPLPAAGHSHRHTACVDRIPARPSAPAGLRGHRRRPPGAVLQQWVKLKVQGLLPQGRLLKLQGRKQGHWGPRHNSLHAPPHVAPGSRPDPSGLQGRAAEAAGPSATSGQRWIPLAVEESRPGAVLERAPFETGT